MARRGNYFLLNKKEDFARGSGAGVVIDNEGISLADGCDTGIYDTRVFDCGERGTQWHRLLLYGSHLRGNVSVTVYAADEETHVSVENPSKASFREAEDVLLTGVSGRFLRLRIQLEKKNDVHIRITRMKICFPGQTWLSYLPELYQAHVREDSFLERYLGIFQALYEDRTERIARIPQRLSPFTVSGEALRELSEWFAIGDEGVWNEEQKRYLILHAPRLLRIRGTAEYVRELLFLGTGKTVYIVEYGQLIPYFDGGKEEERLKRLYTAGPYEFAVLVDTERQEENELYRIGKIVEMAKPAYMACRIVALTPYLFLGQHSYLGINSVLSRFRGLCLDGRCAMPFSVLTGKEGGS
ncbi:MAG: phage tail protein [bacterium]|nr:phage tail protein [bacterium]